jgi:hypothetical protein
MNIEKYVPIKIYSNQFSSNPIKIKKLNMNKEVELFDDSYELKQNFFDPEKGSPPTNWTNRLLERMEKYYNK